MENANYKNKNIEKKYSNTLYDWLINYIPNPIRKVVGGFKDKVVNLFNTNTPKKNLAWERKDTKQTKNTKTI